jgi:hypothetical protein
MSAPTNPRFSTARCSVRSPTTRGRRTTDGIADTVQRLLDDWDARIDRLVGDYREKYDGAAPSATPMEGRRHGTSSARYS